MNRRSFFKTSVAAAVAAALPSGHALASALSALTEVSTDLRGITANGAETTLERAAVQELSDALRGRLLLPGNDGYDDARGVLNVLIDKHPALIIQPSGAADIMSAVDFARERNLLLAVKCGGHSHSGKSTCEGGMQIDLSSFRSAHVEPKEKRAYVAGGSLLGELDHESMAQGLVTTAGTVSHTGVGGLTLGGGFGRLARRFGLALDNVTGVSIVTADGKLLQADAKENPDLYWGIRGGGGNFGIVTEFGFQLHPMQRQVIGGEIIFPLARARDVLSFYADYSMRAPDELYLDYGMMSGIGKDDGICMLSACFSGTAKEADKVLEQLRKVGGSINDAIKPMDYVALQRAWDRDPSDPRTSGHYMKAGFLREIDGKLVDAIIDGFDTDPSRGTTVFFQQSGGAIGRVAEDATAFAHRYSSHNMMASVDWPLGTDNSSTMGYLRGYWNKLESFTDGWYTNGVGDEAAKIVDANYRGNYARLVKIKNKYDPGNLFSLNANIKPTV